jgi:hypothetical protein
VTSRGTPRFWAAYRELPVEVRDAARKAYALFRNDPTHPSLQFKRVHNREPIYSVRVTIAYRALALSKATKPHGSGLAITLTTIAC